MSGTSTIKVVVSGTKQVEPLHRAMAAFARTTPQEVASKPAPVSAAGGAADDRFGKLLVRAVDDHLKPLLKRTSRDADRILGITLRTTLGPMTALAYRTVRTFAGFFLKSTESLLRLKGWGAVFAAIAAALAAGFSLKYIVFPVVKLWVGIKLLRYSWDWVQEVSKSVLTAAAHAMRDTPGLTGVAFSVATQKIESSMRTASILAGDGAEQLMGNLAENFGRFRAEEMETKGSILRMWGLTHAKIRELNSRGAIDPLRLAGYLVRRRDILIRKASEVPQGSLDEKILRRWLELLREHATELGGREFAETVMTFREEHLKRIADNERDIAPISESLRDVVQDSRDFTISLWSLEGAFYQIGRGAVVDALPSMTRTFDSMRRQLLNTDEQGVSLGKRWRELVGLLVQKGWETLIELMKKIKPETVRRLVNDFQNWLNQTLEPETNKLESLISVLAKWIGVGREEMTALTGVDVEKEGGIGGGRGGAGGGRGGGVTARGVVDQSGKTVDPETVAGLRQLAESGNTRGMQAFMASRGYRVDSAWCGDLTRALVGGSGYSVPKGYPVASTWRSIGTHAEGEDINKPGAIFGSIVASKTNVPIGSTGGHVATVVPGTYNPRNNTAIVVDTHGRWRRSLSGFELRILPLDPRNVKPSEVKERRSDAFRKAAYAALENEIKEVRLLSAADKRRLGRIMEAQLIATQLEQAA